LTLAWGPRDAFLLVGTEAGIETWDAQKGTRITEYKVGPTASLTYDQDKKAPTLLTAGQRKVEDVYGRVSYLDTTTGKTTRIYSRAEGRQGEFGVSAFSPNGKWLASAASPSQTIYLWQRNSSEPPHQLKGVGQPCFAVGWGKEGHSIVWGGGAYRSIAVDPD